MSAFRDAPPPKLVCPRDQSTLAARPAEGEMLHVCPRCTGVWLEAATLRRLRADRAAMKGLEKHPLATTATRSGGPETLPGVTCPRCQAHCVRRLHGRGEAALVVDSCREHGVWLDGGELAALLRHERGAPPWPPDPRREADPLVVRVVQAIADVYLALWP